ncbi:MAG TPA: phosphate ABC transporter permease subunit PstC [Anaerolineales bacterium]|jgi:phosphate transport system permease protein|nr:phosphate ABC transporter permease subunit PstC [Anaerolineales bacterium]
MDRKIKQLPSNHWFNKFQRVTSHGDLPWQGIIIAASILVMIVILAIGLLLWRDTSNARQQFGWAFLLPTSNPNWDPVNDQFDAWPFMYGTLLTSLAALVLAVPISLGIAIFMSELCPEWLRLPLNWLVELLAAVPSVVYGLWGIFIFLPVVVAPVGQFLFNAFGSIPLLSVLFTGPVPVSGASRLGAALILTIMITPTITAVARDVLLAIPPNQREAALALGATQWEMIWQVLLPYGLSGILGAVILGLGRALGETMAVTMVIGNSIEGSASLLRPGYTMASIIANEFAEAVSQLHSEALVEIGLVLFFMTLLLNILARLLVWRVARRTPQEARA